MSTLTSLERYCALIESGEVVPRELTSFGMLVPVPSRPLLLPWEFAEYERVLATPGAHTDWIGRSGWNHSFAQLNSARHSRHIVVWLDSTDDSLRCYFGSLDAMREYRF